MGWIGHAILAQQSRSSAIALQQAFSVAHMDAKANASKGQHRSHDTSTFSRLPIVATDCDKTEL